MRDLFHLVCRSYYPVIGDFEETLHSRNWDNFCRRQRTLLVGHRSRGKHRELQLLPLPALATFLIKWKGHKDQLVYYEDRFLGEQGGTTVIASAALLFPCGLPLSHTKG